MERRTLPLSAAQETLYQGFNETFLRGIIKSWSVNTPLMINAPRYDCAIDAAMSVIEGRWKTVIICKLAHEGSPLRFNQIMAKIPGISPRVLTLQLREMERDNIIVRNVVSTSPKCVEYCLSDRGMSLIPILVQLAEWGLQNMFPNMVVFDTEIVSTQDEIKA